MQRNLITVPLSRLVESDANVRTGAYLAAGGRTQVDLFESTAYWLDGALTRDMALAKMGAEAEAIRAAEGWAWALALLNPSYSDMEAFGRAPTTLREPTKKEAATIKKLDTRKTKIERDMGDIEERGEEESEAYAALSDEWDRIEGELSDLQDQMQVVAVDVAKETAKNPAVCPGNSELCCKK